MRAFELSLVKWEVIGHNGIHVSHLQFSDDTTLFIEPKVEFILNLRRILRCFELVCGLKINFHKLCLVKVWKKGSDVVDWAGMLNCRTSLLPITYLGLPLEANPQLLRKDPRQCFSFCQNNEIFALTSSKHGKVYDFGDWHGMKWRWKNLCPPKIQVFGWHLYKGRIMINERLSLLWELCIDPPTLKRTSPVGWSPPPLSSLKFNVDGSSRGNHGPAGIEGVLRDSSGEILCLFSTAVGLCDSNTTEIRAIHKVVQLCSSGPLLRNQRIEIISDYKVAVLWINNKMDFGSYNHVQLIYDIMTHLHFFRNMIVTYNSRRSNSIADLLAKLGSSRKWVILFLGMI
ncbi:hypothetical protein Dsin_012840 [Dipteronia sinensis]|uniref:RNase H type-1 domain-containing protein n=1 Tax=Dipteronia sinensis TaxID=43782 RepID=A0AAE0AJL3_9ROSI|nr:hypothetical protein Dsin_012840 [Dipteronia sinensis]